MREEETWSGSRASGKPRSTAPPLRSARSARNWKPISAAPCRATSPPTSSASATPPSTAGSPPATSRWSITRRRAVKRCRSRRSATCGSGSNESRHPGRRRLHRLEPAMVESRRRAERLEPDPSLLTELEDRRDRPPPARRAAQPRLPPGACAAAAATDDRPRPGETRSAGSAKAGSTPSHAAAWRELLERPLGEIRSAIGADDDRGRDLRQNSPLAGLISEPERRKIFESVKASA